MTTKDKKILEAMNKAADALNEVAGELYGVFYKRYPLAKFTVEVGKANLSGKEKDVIQLKAESTSTKKDGNAFIPVIIGYEIEPAKAETSKAKTDIEKALEKASPEDLSKLLSVLFPEQAKKPTPKKKK